jgi:hypothetical protein
MAMVMECGVLNWQQNSGISISYYQIRTPDGQLKRGWIRCGGWIWGIFANKADVEWDE